MNTEVVKKSILYFLFALALFLGYLVLKQNYSGHSKQVNNNNSAPSKIDSNEFSDDQQKLLLPPAPNSSKDKIDEHFQLAAKLSVAGEKVVIKDCKVEPIVLRTNFENSVLFENQDETSISISFDNNNSFEIAGKKSVSIKEAFVHGPGLYGYLCSKENFKGLVGFIMLVK